MDADFKDKEKLKMTAPATNIFVGVNPETGAPQIMPSRGKPTITEIEPPAGGIGAKTLSEDYKKDVTAYKQAGDLVSSLKKTWGGLGVTDRTSNVMLAGKARIGKHSSAKLYMDAREAFLGNLSRSLAAERGVLTQQDIERIERALPEMGFNPLTVDSKEEANKKWGFIEDILKSAEKRMKERSQITYTNPTGEGTKEPTKPPITPAEAAAELKRRQRR